MAELEPFYLAGGTAVAYHLGHRTSLDLDLFSVSHDVDLETVREALLDAIPDTEVLAATDVILKARILGELVDIVRYRYPPLEPPTLGPAGVPVAGLLDLAVMKLSAIARRGIRRDFWDLHAILASGTNTLRRVAEAYVQRFGVSESDLYHVARALTYFADAEKDTAFPRGLSPAHWDEIKRTFLREAPTLLTP